MRREFGSALRARSHGRDREGHPARDQRAAEVSRSGAEGSRTLRIEIPDFVVTPRSSSAFRRPSVSALSRGLPNIARVNRRLSRPERRVSAARSSWRWPGVPQWTTAEGTGRSRQLRATEARSSPPARLSASLLARALASCHEGLLDETIRTVDLGDHGVASIAVATPATVLKA